MRKFAFILCVGMGFVFQGLSAQEVYVQDDGFSLGIYGRIGIDWNFANQSSVGRRLNLNNMGSVGGRLEEQDYLEFAPSFRFSPFNKNDSTSITVGLRFAAYSTTLNMIGYGTTAASGIDIALPEMFVEADNIANSGVKIWIGARMYGAKDIHIADHFYFSDHTGQGFGVEYRNTRFTTIAVSSTDTSSTLPPYFYLNHATGTPQIALRKRTVLALEHDLHFSGSDVLTALLEYHHMAKGGTKNDTIKGLYNFPGDNGWVAGLRWEHDFENKASWNRLALRYGAGIANGGEGGLSFSWLTFGAPDTLKMNYKGAYSLSVVNDLFLDYKRHSFNPYLVYTLSKGAARGNGMSPTYMDREVYNRKHEYTIGCRSSYYINPYFHLITELHYSGRQDGDADWARMTKLSIAPTIVPTGEKSSWARPHLRLVASIARYNDFARNSLYSPYLEFVGNKSNWGHYIGIKAEWWTD